ncbi:hypothetical protein MSG28_003303 [Choristoneura fumiferana]|uniref:Uncharacterized protein n=1 Tax=Choristoneura fumiferana TaxID=7141 RepID=A0ACC0KEY7_CHOFU|nr:hypothetical protein MSG28_003303 [Choristoneura fumiferana]
MCSASYGAKFAADYVQGTEEMEPNSTTAENSSVCSSEQSVHRTAIFPFKSTPSGNLKVQSNQSSTVGVLLADPTQAKVKVKFEGKAAGEPDDDTEQHYVSISSLFKKPHVIRLSEFKKPWGSQAYPKSFRAICLEMSRRPLEDPIAGRELTKYDTYQSDAEPQLQFGSNEANLQLKTQYDREHGGKTKTTGVREDIGKDLGSLGYAMAEPVDWIRIQLPKKQDLFQEFYRRIHNYVNTDAIIHIGDEEFHCHHIVLQVYSAFFNSNTQKDITLPTSNVTPEAFQTIYEWMIFSGPESNKALKRNNILDLFCAAQFLAIKGKLFSKLHLEDQCWAFIVNDTLFTEDTAFALFREARTKGITPVMDLMVERWQRTKESEVGESFCL